MAIVPIRLMARRVAGACVRAVQRTVADAWPLLQGTAAAVAAWVIARHVFDHPEPFFAPIAALIALNTSLGERGRNAVRLLQGVVTGIAVGELALFVAGGGYGSLALATFAATAAARAMGGTRIVIAQAAVGAILTVALADAQAGFQRLLDALIGAGVALVFSQVLFSPEPVALLRRAQSLALARMAAGLSLAAGALEQDDDELAEQAIESLRDLRDDLVELGRIRRASTRVARRSLVWRSRMAPVVHERENAGHVDLLGGSCLMLARTAAGVPRAERRRLQPSLRELADTLNSLAADLSDRRTRQAAADRALAVTREVTARDAPPDSPLTVAITAVRLVATDLMVFAGVDLDIAAKRYRKEP
jgi:fusaric acid resistance family protein